MNREELSKVFGEGVAVSPAGDVKGGNHPLNSFD